MTSDFLWVVSFLCCVCFDLCVMIPLMSSQLRLRLRCNCDWGLRLCTRIRKSLFLISILRERETERESIQLFCANWEKLESMKCQVRLPPIAPTPPIPPPHPLPAHTQTDKLH